MHRLLRFCAALALTLPLLSYARPAAAQRPSSANSLKTATAEADPVVFSWVDAPDGSISSSDTEATKVHDTYAGTLWSFTSDGQLQIGRKSGNQLQTVATLAQAHNNDNSFFLYHFRSKDGKQSIDGSFTVDSTDATKAFANFNVVAPGANGTTVSSWVQINLTIQTQKPAQ